MTLPLPIQLPVEDRATIAAVLNRHLGTEYAYVDIYHARTEDNDAMFWTSDGTVTMYADAFRSHLHQIRIERWLAQVFRNQPALTAA